MTESTNGKVTSLSWLNSETSEIAQNLLSGSTTKKASLRELAWKVAPNLLLSVKYAWAGVRYAFITQRNFRIHTIIATLAISLGLFLKVSAIEMAVITLTCAIVMVLELLNTAIESVVDLTVKQTYHELAKIAKDCAAGAVLISAIAAVLVAMWILLPPLLQLIFSI
ncbi:MAG: diacylglycerol kinase family protein [Xenococcaceae cyanobacterium MO_207.B15]|nr:diacylglycerol kinase family protein [Xenococcaceae cyanobacterium MO_207.B15]MDJ0743670.1 diacylglycerol kinase family protein [Xenococcaceae cyanobacterium MO_167.B27]